MAISVSLPPVQSLVLAGPNGAGKSTLLLMLLGLVRPHSGRIEINGRPLFDAARNIDVPTENRQIGYMPQSYALFPQMTVLQNVTFGLDCSPNRMTRKQRLARAQDLLAELKLTHLRDRYPRELSGGEAQRVALARAVAPNPKALLLDEPMAALDMTARSEVRSFFAAYLAAKGLPTVVISHDPADAVFLGEQVAVMENGRVVQNGTWDELRRNPLTDFVARFANPAGASHPQHGSPAWSGTAVGI